MIDSKEIHTFEENLNTIKNLSTQSNAKYLKLLFGSISYLSKFIPKLHAICAPFYDFMKKSIKWNETEKEALLDQNKK